MLAVSKLAFTSWYVYLNLAADLFIVVPNKKYFFKPLTPFSKLPVSLGLIFNLEYEKFWGKVTTSAQRYATFKMLPFQ